MTRRQLWQGTSAVAGTVLLLSAARAVPVLLDPVALLDDEASRCAGPYPWADAIGYAVLVAITAALAAGGAALLRRLRRGGGPTWLVASGLLLGLLAVASVATAPAPDEGNGLRFDACLSGEPSLVRPLALALAVLALAATIAVLLRRRSRR